MLAFHNDPKIKEFYINQLKAHYDADEIIKGKYWENGKGCAIGCIVHTADYPHKVFEEKTGIKRILGKLIDRIFENLPNEIAKEFPLRIFNATPVGADLNLVFYQFMHWLLIDKTDGIIKFAKKEKSRKAIQDIANLFEKKINGKNIERQDWNVPYAAAAADADTAAAYAYAAAADADTAAAYAYAANAAAADAAAYAAAAAAAAYAANAADADAYAAAAAAAADAANAAAADAAAYAAADAAAYAAAAAAAAYAANAADADAYAAAADAAAYAAYAAAADAADAAAADAADADAAAYAIRQQVRVKQADKLVELISACIP